MSSRFAALVSAFGADRARLDVRLAPFTTFRVGGPADCLLEVRDSAELAQAARLAHEAGIPVTLLGGGSNLLASDAGVRGVVLRVRGGATVELNGGRADADAGVSLNGFVRWTIGRGLAGLEAWAGTPGTVGGAVFGNAHYGGRSIGELIESVRVLGEDGRATDVPAAEMAFAYDRSRLQETGEVLLSARFVLAPGADPAQLRETARRSLAHRKRTQPLDTPSAGCIFQNPDPAAADRVPDGIPASAGALIDRAGLKGHAIGGARVSTVHANFVVNDGSATASEIRSLIALCRDTVRARFGVELREEIRYLGDWACEMKNEE
jgi:UDP-N-acetylmuramate dehydrogenase